MDGFNGLNMGLGTLARLSTASSRSITAENPDGASGGGGRSSSGTGARAARDLGIGWKVSPSVIVPSGREVTLAEISGNGQIQHIWMVPITCRWRHLILRMYWDGAKQPAVQVPFGDFFALGWEEYAHVNSLPVCVNPGRGFNCFWPMPFSNGARITLENRDDVDEILYYQIDYTITHVESDLARFHAWFDRANPSPAGENKPILDTSGGPGHYVGTYLAWGVNNGGWWGEGEMKFFIDDDDEFPTICGTGTEDYFLGAYNFDIGTAEPDKPSCYTEYCTPFAGLAQVLRPDGVYRSQQRFGMYRWHVMDPIRFTEGLRVTVQDLGWIEAQTEDDRRYLLQASDIASTAFFYQAAAGLEPPPLPDRDSLQVV